jgi:predicted negative regulator of RcsB-dependent stress response
LDIYASEQEQVEALRKWFRENWLALVLGVGLGLGSLFGYRFWQDQVTAKAEAAADLYAAALGALATADMTRIETLRKQLQDEYPTTPYAALAALAEANLRTGRDELAAARELVDWTLAHAKQAELLSVARLRQARLLLAEEQADAALAALDVVQAQPFAAQVAELRGDIHRQRGDRAAAAEAYRRALEAGGDNRGLVRMKLDDLGIPQAEEK